MKNYLSAPAVVLSSCFVIIVIAMVTIHTSWFLEENKLNCSLNYVKKSNCWLHIICIVSLNENFNTVQCTFLFRWYRDRIHNGNLWWIPNRKNTALSYSCCNLPGTLLKINFPQFTFWQIASLISTDQICQEVWM